MIDTQNKSVTVVLNEVLAKLITQGQQCMDDGFDGNGIGQNCSYGDGNGNHCAIGWLLPEDDEELMDFGDYVVSLLHEFDNLGPNDQFIRENADVLVSFQELHDIAVLNDDLKPLLNESLVDQWVAIVEAEK